MQTATPRRPSVAVPLKATGPTYNRMFVLAAEQNLLNDFERAERLRLYQVKLGVADWHYEHTDNALAWRAGRDEFSALYEMQAELDPSGAIWRSVAPEGFAVPQPRVKTGGAL